MRSGAPAVIAGVLTLPLFAAGFYLRMNAAYGPLNLSLYREDWVLLWDLFRYGQVSSRVTMESAAAGAFLAVLPWAGVWAARRRARVGNRREAV